MERPYLVDRVLEAAYRATSRPVAVIDLRGASGAFARARLAPPWHPPPRRHDQIDRTSLRQLQLDLLRQ
jgi:hypothetical protein